MPWSPAYWPLHLDPLHLSAATACGGLSTCSCLYRVPHFSSRWFLRSLLFWHQLVRVLLSFLRLISLVDSIVVFLNFMPSVPQSYLHLRIPWKGSVSLRVDMVDVPGSYLREVAKGIDTECMCVQHPEGKSFVDWTPVPGPAMYIFK